MTEPPLQPFFPVVRTTGQGRGGMLSWNSLCRLGAGQTLVTAVPDLSLSQADSKPSDSQGLKAPWG